MTYTTTLSSRDLEIADLAAGGLSARDIAGRLAISTNTVIYHLKRVYEALGVHNRLQLANSLRDRKNYPNG
jgi:LuxR family maltose regulon positive regulatory protein